MKIGFTVFLILSFVGIAVFSIFAMNHDAYGQNECIAEIAREAGCPENGALFSFIAFHLDFFRSFSAAVFWENFTGALLLFFSVLLAISLGFMGGFKFNPPPQPFAILRFLEHPFPFQKQFTHWLAFHENSPASL